ncbi:MAG: hypothetical protein HYT66_00915 [Candidatus Yanofskybacteria bacterium]|nr:hypothetical protein [Candidatus Yanofskybacteria bacterium]
MKSKWYHPIFYALVFFAYIGAIFIIFPSPEEIAVKQVSEIVQIGQPTDKFDGLLSKIKKDIDQKNIEIKVLVGPYFRYMGIIGLLYDEFRPTYFILIDEEFYDELVWEEKEALVTHESGHILYRYPRENSRAAITELQVLADEFGAKFVHPKYLASLLKKVNSDYFIRVKHLERAARGQ